MVDIYIDGASSGNPGNAGVGYILFEEDKPLAQKSVFLGKQTNNFAEYMALIFALTHLLGLQKTSCRVYSDSQLLCEQLHGNYKVKNENIAPLFVLAKHLIGQLSSFTITHIPREKNTQADALSKIAVQPASVCGNQSVRFPVAE